MTPLENIAVLVITECDYEILFEQYKGHLKKFRGAIPIRNVSFDTNQNNNVYIAIYKEGYELHNDTLYTKQDTLVERYISLKPEIRTRHPAFNKD